MLCHSEVQFQPVEAPANCHPALLDRFWSKVARVGASECWLWKGPLDRYGYGQFTLAGRPRRAHRVAYWLDTGRWYAPDVKLRHSCDQRGCCNPAHMTPGTQADNMRDRMEREGYRTMRRGERHGMVKLTDAQVSEIRAAVSVFGVCNALAKDYGVTASTISRIRAGVRRP